MDHPQRLFRDPYQFMEFGEDHNSPGDPSFRFKGHSCFTALCPAVPILVHDQVTIIFVVSVGLFVCLCSVFLSHLWSDFDQSWTYVIWRVPCKKQVCQYFWFLLPLRFCTLCKPIYHVNNKSMLEMACVGKHFWRTVYFDIFGSCFAIVWLNT